MADIYEFINSKDIREYCRKIGHEFNTVESAFLIYQSRRHTLEQKFNAWQELAATAPDMEIKERLNCKYYPSVHEFLQKYMDLYKSLLADFYSEDEDSTFTWSSVCRPRGNEDDPMAEYESRHLFTDLNTCIYSMMNHEKDKLEEGSLEKFIISKVYLAREARTGLPGVYPELTLSKNLKCTALNFPFSLKRQMSDEEADLFLAFDGMWIDVPTPFKYGDILYKSLENGGWNEPFVLCDLCTQPNPERTDNRYLEWYGKHRRRLIEKGDTSDMIAYGYWIYRDGPGKGMLYSECVHRYQDLEFYPNQMKGYDRILAELSHFLKEEEYTRPLQWIDFMNVYHGILMDEMGNSICAAVQGGQE